MKGSINDARASKDGQDYSKTWCNSVWIKYTFLPALNLSFMSFMRNYKEPWYSLTVSVAPKPFWLFRNSVIDLNIRVNYTTGDINSDTSGPLLSRFGLLKAEVLGFDLRVSVTQINKDKRRRK